MDDEIREIIARYVREVKDERMRESWANVPYAHEEFEERRILLAAIV